MMGCLFPEKYNSVHFVLSPLTRALLLALAVGSLPVYVQAQESETVSADSATSGDLNNIEFNTDVMDVKDRANVDTSHFARAGYVMPGEYPLSLNVNGTDVRDISVTFASSPEDPKSSEPCITSDMVSYFGLKEKMTKQLVWKDINSARCLDISSLPGMTAVGDLSSGALRVALPQAYLEYSSPDWDPPSRWDEGIAGLLFDYNLNGSKNYAHSGGSNSVDISANGTTGMNIGPWRFRADWQAQRYSSNERTTQNFSWSRYYLYRALPGIGARLTMGESDLESTLFDSFRFAGVSLVTDDNMLPPNLQGYAPEVSGVARSNAKVIISQQGRIIFQTQVAPGPFRIQELNQATSGTLDVRVEEQDGSVQRFQVDTASIPYLTRPGMVRYKFSAGRPTDWKHRIQGDPFASSEFSWGVSNGWSLFGGTIVSKDYDAMTLGVGRDLLALGALSFDVTQSHATLPQEGTKKGASYRVSYSKRFEKIDSQVTFAGYRFSERNFMSMSDYLESRFHDSAWGMTTSHQKELYTITASKAFQSLNMSLYGNYSHRTYWDRPDSDRYSLTLTQYLNIKKWRNVSLSLTGYRSEYWGIKDDGAYISISVPWSNGGTLSYRGQKTHSGTTNSIGWSDDIDANNSYSIQAGKGIGSRNEASGYFSHDGDYATGSLSASYSEANYSTIGMALRGGMTVTRYGAALHPVSTNGGTRLMIDTGDSAGVPLKDIGAVQRTNRFGKAVVTGIGSYWRNSVGVDVDSLADDMEVSHPLTELTLTEGAIGYRKIDVMQGLKMMAALRYQDGSSPAFGSIIYRDKYQTGVIDDNGTVWLSGIKPGGDMVVRENGNPVCTTTIPQTLPPENSGKVLLLTCHKLESSSE